MSLNVFISQLDDFYAFMIHRSVLRGLKKSALCGQGANVKRKKTLKSFYKAARIISHDYFERLQESLAPW